MSVGDRARMADERGGTRGRLVIVAGLPGAGKTTLAVRVAAALSAARMCPDDWMRSAGLDLWDSHARDVIEGTQHAIALELLRAGRNVVIEFGSWTRDERDRLRDSARDTGAAVELRYVTAPTDELWQRLADRGNDTRFGARAVDEAELAAWASLFEVPTADEFAEYDPPFGGGA